MLPAGREKRPTHHSTRIQDDDTAIDYCMDVSGNSSSPEEILPIIDAFTPAPGLDQISGAAHVVGGEVEPNSMVARTKRIACMLCRRRKLKCDGCKPFCGTCSRLDRTCTYSEARKKSGPKRGYVKALEERLKQVETLLSRQKPASPTELPKENGQAQQPSTAPHPNLTVPDPVVGISGDHRDKDQYQTTGGDSHYQAPPSTHDYRFGFTGANMGGDANVTWEMISLGLHEPLPPQEMINELHTLYFSKVHIAVPIIHRPRYLAAMNLAPFQRPPIALRYAIWALACIVTDKYQNYRDLFYQRARKYNEIDTNKSYGECILSVAHAQTHVLLSFYELHMMYFPRAWMSAGAAVRSCQMTGFHRLDGATLDVKQCMAPPRDWTETEERRRTFWMAFCIDRYSSIGSGWPMAVDEQDIHTNLPASEAAFELSRSERTPSLEESLTPAGAAKLSSFGSIVFATCHFGRNLLHLHRPSTTSSDRDMNGEFWRRHREIHDTLSKTTLHFPESLRLPGGAADPSVVFASMCIQASTICLHQAAIFVAEKNNLSPSVSAESKIKCISAANEMTNILRIAIRQRQGLSNANPFMCFNLYLAARVYVQYLKSRPEDVFVVESMRFILATMNTLRRTSPLSESLLVQLDVDLEILIQKKPSLKGVFSRITDLPSQHSKFEGIGLKDYRSCVEIPTENDRAGLTGGGYPGSQYWFSGDHPDPSNDSSSSGMGGTTLTPGSGSLHDGSNGNQGVYGQMGNVGGDLAGISPRPDMRSGLATGSSQLVMRGLGGGGQFARQTVAASQPNVMAGGVGGGGVGSSADIQGFYTDSQVFSMADADALFTISEAQAGDFGLQASSTEAMDVSGQGEGMMGQPMMMGQAMGMTPVGEGVLRSLMNMGPTDLIDISQWTSA